MNPLSDFFIAKDGSRLPEAVADIARIGGFCRDAYKEKAFTANRRKLILGGKGAKLENVDKVAGLWRIQTKFPHKITRVRDKDVVLIKKSKQKDSTNFKYWEAKVVGYNCHGPFIFSGEKPDLIVARYDTDDGPLWGYGATIEAARAFLGLKIWDKYKDVIHAAVRGKKTK